MKYFGFRIADRRFILIADFFDFGLRIGDCGFNLKSINIIRFVYKI